MAGGGGEAASPSPFDIISLDATGHAQIFPGTVNQLVPDNMFTPLVFGIGVGYLTLQCTSDGRTVTLVHLAAETSAPSLPDATANAAPTAFKVVLAVVVGTSVTGGTSFVSYRVWPVNANVLANIILALRVSRTTPEPGELGYTPYYNWQITTDLVIQG